ncbi:MAG: acyl-CoA thioesterase II [Acidimicrobiales bacterium]
MTTRGAAVTPLVDLLNLEQVEVNIFRGVSLDEERRRVFGGQVAAQALVAAGRTVEHRRVHSLHAYFLRPGDPHRPILYEVERLRDGHSFSARSVAGIQHGETILAMACSFHKDEEGLTHGESIPDVPEPETLTSVAELVGTDDEVPHSLLNTYGLDVRFVSEYPWRRRGEGSEAEQLWFRATGPVPDDALIHAAIVTFAADLTLVDTILQRHGMMPYDDRFMGASLDHCVWFHRPIRADDWLFYDQTSPIAYGARGLARGLLFAHSGALVASVVQEGLVRLRLDR